MKSPFRQRSRQATYLEDLLREVEELRGENARLRMDATRPASMQDARARLAEIAGRYKTVGEGAIHGTKQDRLDEAWHLMAEAQRVRSSLMSVLSDLAAACGQLSRQMAIDGGSMEIDRRITERRSPAAELASGAAGRDRVEEAIGQSLEIVAAVTDPETEPWTPPADSEEAAATPSRQRSGSQPIDDRRARSNGNGNGIGNGNGDGKVDHAPGPSPSWTHE
jgi:hypothetical protein